MKYFIMPILKFLTAILFTIICSILIAPVQILKAIWRWKFNDIFIFKYDANENFHIISSLFLIGFNFSPYWHPIKYGIYSEHRYYFKTVYHFIWDIKNGGELNVWGSFPYKGIGERNNEKYVKIDYVNKEFPKDYYTKTEKKETSKELELKIANFREKLARLNKEDLTVSIDYVLKEILGFSDEEINKLKNK